MSISLEREGGWVLFFGHRVLRRSRSFPLGKP
jgi:hypothetical protein